MMLLFVSDLVVVMVVVVMVVVAAVAAHCWWSLIFFNKGQCPQEQFATNICLICVTSSSCLRPKKYLHQWHYIAYLLLTYMSWINSDWKSFPIIACVSSVSLVFVYLLQQWISQPANKKHTKGIHSKFKGKSWVPMGDIYQHIPPIYGLYNGFMGQYGVMFWAQLLGYLPKGTQLFPLTNLGRVQHPASSRYLA